MEEAPAPEPVYDCAPEPVYDCTPAAEAEAASQAEPMPPSTNPPAFLANLAETISSCATMPTAPPVPTFPLTGFDPTRLEEAYMNMACESDRSHILTVTALLNQGGDGAKTFCKIFLNDPVLQTTVIGALMSDPNNTLNCIHKQHKELALRLAASGQARAVAQVLLQDV